MSTNRRVNHLKTHPMNPKIRLKIHPTNRATNRRCYHPTNRVIPKIRPKNHRLMRGMRDELFLQRAEPSCSSPFGEVDQRDLNFRQTNRASPMTRHLIRPMNPMNHQKIRLKNQAMRTKPVLACLPSYHPNFRRRNRAIPMIRQSYLRKIPSQPKRCHQSTKTLNRQLSTKRVKNL
jgi:hypothetical protein